MNEHTRARNIPESVNINEYTRARIFQDPFTSTNKHAPGIFRDPDERVRGGNLKFSFALRYKKGDS